MKDIDKEQDSEQSSGQEEDSSESNHSKAISALLDSEDIDLENESVQQFIKGFAIRKSISTSSPIPPPDTIKAYDEIDPIYSKTYLEEWVTTNQTKRELDRQASNREDKKVDNQHELDQKESNRQTTLMWISAVISCLAITFAFIAGILGFPVTAGLLGAVGGATGVTSAIKFIARKK